MSRDNFYNKEELLKSFVHYPITQQRALMHYLGLLLPDYQAPFESRYNDWVNAIVSHNISNSKGWRKKWYKLINELCILNRFIINSHIKGIKEIKYEPKEYGGDFSLHFLSEKVIILEITEVYTPETTKFNKFLIQLNDKFDIPQFLIVLISNRMELARYQAEIDLFSINDTESIRHLKYWYILLANIVYNLTESPPIANPSDLEIVPVVANNIKNSSSKADFNFNEFYSQLPNLQPTHCKELIEFMTMIINRAGGIKDNISRALKNYPKEANKYNNLIDHIIKKITDIMIRLNKIDSKSQPNIIQVVNLCAHRSCIKFITVLASEIIVPALERAINLPQLPARISDKQIYDYLESSSKSYQIENIISFIREGIKKKFEKYNKRPKSSDIQKYYLVIDINCTLEGEYPSHSLKQKVNNLIEQINTHPKYQSHNYFSHILISGLNGLDFLFAKVENKWVVC